MLDQKKGRFPDKPAVLVEDQFIPRDFLLVDLLPKLIRPNPLRDQAWGIIDLIRRGKIQGYLTDPLSEQFFRECAEFWPLEGWHFANHIIEEFETKKLIFSIDKFILASKWDDFEMYPDPLAEVAAVSKASGLPLLAFQSEHYEGLYVYSVEDVLQVHAALDRQYLERCYDQSREQEENFYLPYSSLPVDPHVFRRPSDGSASPSSGGSGLGGGIVASQGLVQGSLPNISSNPSSTNSNGGNARTSNSPNSSDYFIVKNNSREGTPKIDSGTHLALTAEGVDAVDYSPTTQPLQSSGDIFSLEHAAPVAESTQQHSLVAQFEPLQQGLSGVGELPRGTQNLSNADSKHFESGKLPTRIPQFPFKSPPDDGSDDGDSGVLRGSSNPSPFGGGGHSPNSPPSGTGGLSDTASSGSSSTGTNSSSGNPGTSNSAIPQSVSGANGNQVFTVQTNDGRITIDNFGGVGRGSNPSQEIINAVDTIRFRGTELTAENMVLTQEEGDLVITFDGSTLLEITLTDFSLENLDNLSQVNGTSAVLGNILFNGDDSIQDRFDVFNSDWNLNRVLSLNKVTFLNDLNNRVLGFDNSNDVINGQGGDDIIITLSGDDIIRGGSGNDLLDGGSGTNTLWGGSGSDTFVLSPYGYQYVNDFKVGEDYIGLPSGLTADQIKIEQGTGVNSSSTFFKLTTNDTNLMFLKGVQANVLTTDIFVSISDRSYPSLSS